MATIDPKQTHVAHQWKHDSPLIACRFDPKGQFVFASAQDNSVQRWHLESEKKVSLAAHDSWVRGIAFADGGRQVVTAGCDGRLIWWPTEAEAPTPIRTIDAHQGWIRSAELSHDGKLLVTGGNDNLVKVWNASTGEAVAEFTGHEKDVYSALFHAGGEWILSGDLAGQVHQWELATGKLLRKFDAKQLHTYNGGQGVDFGGVRALTISPDGKYLAAGGLHKATNPLGAVHEPLLLIFEWESQKLVQSHVAEGLKAVVWRALFPRPDFVCAAASGSSGGFFVFWKREEPKDFHRFKLPHLARDMDLHPDGVQLASAHYDKHLRISKMIAKEEGK